MVQNLAAGAIYCLFVLKINLVKLHVTILMRRTVFLDKSDAGTTHLVFFGTSRSLMFLFGKYPDTGQVYCEPHIHALYTFENII
jgi:hypothetical protein